MGDDSLDNVFTYNQFHGQPQLSSVGLPLELAGTNLPTSIPSDKDSESDSIGYPPLFDEIPTRGNGATKSVLPKVSTAPTLWQTLASAVLGSPGALNNRNSTQAIVSGANTTLNTALPATGATPTK